MLPCARQPQLRYSWEASLLQTLQLLRELLQLMSVDQARPEFPGRTRSALLHRAAFLQLKLISPQIQRRIRINWRRVANDHKPCIVLAHCVPYEALK